MYSSFVATYQVAQPNHFFPSNNTVLITEHSAFILKEKKEKEREKEISDPFCLEGIHLVFLGMDVAFCFFPGNPH